MVLDPGRAGIEPRIELRDVGGSTSVVGIEGPDEVELCSSEDPEAVLQAAGAYLATQGQAARTSALGRMRAIAASVERHPASAPSP